VQPGKDGAALPISANPDGPTFTTNDPFW
jgi:hypothetical protein